MNYAIKIIFFTISICSVQLSFGYVPAQVSALKQALSPNSTSTRMINCAGCDFRGTTSLAGVDAHGVYMPGVKFQACVPTDANKGISTMICIKDQVADLTGINLANANISNSSFDGAILVGADLTGADFSTSSAAGANLNNAKVAGLLSVGASFCNATMPDGTICDGNTVKTWSGQGVLIDCNCPPAPPATK